MPMQPGQVWNNLDKKDCKGWASHLHIWPGSTFLTEAVTLSTLPDLSWRCHVLLNCDNDDGDGEGDGGDDVLLQEAPCLPAQSDARVVKMKCNFEPWNQWIGYYENVANLTEWASQLSEKKAGQGGNWGRGIC